MVRPCRGSQEEAAPTLTLVVLDQLHVVGTFADEALRVVDAVMRAASVIEQTLVLICKHTSFHFYCLCQGGRAVTAVR